VEVRRTAGRNGRRRGRQHVGVLPALAAVLVACLTGCGGSGDDDEGLSKTEAWADDVCSSVQDWTDALSSAQASLSDTSNLSADSVRAAITDVSSATKTFVSDLKSVGSPGTDAGDQAEQELQTLSGNLEEQDQVIKEATSTKSDNLDSMLAQVSTVTGALATMVSDARTTVTNIQGLDGAQEIEDAFRSAPACTGLTGGGSPGS